LRRRGRWELVLLVVLLLAVGLSVVKIFEEWNVVGATERVNATILDALPTPNGIVIIVSAGDNIYRIYTNATMVNSSRPVILYFKDGKLEKVEQDGVIFGVLKVEMLRTLEKMPKVVNDVSKNETGGTLQFPFSPQGGLRNMNVPFCI